LGLSELVSEAAIPDCFPHVSCGPIALKNPGNRRFATMP
jgi:hypothetical protein